MQYKEIIFNMRKTASYRVSRLSRFCTDPEEADKKIREAIGWGLQLQKRTVRMIKLERLLRSSKWEAFELRECNTEGGEEILDILPGWRSPWSHNISWNK